MAEYDRKNCPLKFAIDKLSVSTYPCDEEKCAWWNIDFEECIFCRIARELVNLIPPKWVGGAK